jgi:hypothetical protein
MRRIEGRMEFGDGYSVAWGDLGSSVYLYTAYGKDAATHKTQTTKIDPKKVRYLAIAFCAVADLLEEMGHDESV